MLDPLRATAYADVNEALHYLLEQTQAILADRFVGMYLSGSLALGDFDPRRSDLDYVVVTSEVLSDELFEGLRGMHARFDASTSPWAAKIEAVYVSRSAFSVKRDSGASYPQIENGRALFMDQLESGWIFHCYTLREHPVVLAGPDPRMLIDPVDPDVMRRAAAPVAITWLEQAKSDPTWLDWLRPRRHQAFVVLTLCRLLYTLDTGAVASKPAAARWAQAALGHRWLGLIERSLGGQQVSAPVTAGELADTLDLLQYIVERFRRTLGVLGRQPP